jgi:thymidylate synthase (FAD)
MEKLLMHVKLISFTQPPAYVHGNSLVYADQEESGGYLNSDLTKLVAYCARVSNPANQHNDETSDKLIGYLIKWKHWSPFEMVNVCLEIDTTRDIARQILRHRSFTFQEFSQRYASVDSLDMEPQIREARLQDLKNRQNSIETQDENLQMLWEARQRAVWETAIEQYQWALDNGIAKEVARAVLPEGLTKSRMYMNGTLRSWIHYIDIRSDKATQKEHRMIALECAKVIAEIFPLINNFSHNETE